MFIDDAFEILAEAFRTLIDAINGITADHDIMEAIEDAAEEAMAMKEEPTFPVVHVIRMRSTGLKSETITRTLIPL